VAISREAGARGNTIAKKVSELVGWQVFDQETLDYLNQDDAARERLLGEVPESAVPWVEAHFARLQQNPRLGADPEASAMVRLLLGVAARGDAVIVGRGAGFFLPPASTIHVRIVAAFDRRVAYFAQSLRLTREEAAEEVRARDERRANFLARLFGRDLSDPTGYDIIVNADRLGIEGAAQFIAWGIRTKQMFHEIQASEEPGGYDDSTVS
jgi:hypothetical protein